MMRRSLAACAALLMAAAALGDTYAQLAFNNATVQPSGPRSGANGKNFYNIEGANNGSFASYGLVRWDSAAAKSHFDSVFGAGNWTIDKIQFSLTQSNAAFSHDGGVDVYFTGDDAVNIEPATSPLQYPFAGDFPDAQLVTHYTYIKTNSGDIDTYTLYDAAGSNSAGALALLNDVLSNNTITLANVETQPDVAATYAGFSNTQYAGPTLTFSAVVPEPTAALLLVAGALLARRGR